jgi:tRNA pseudouridine13 synthase
MTSLTSSPPAISPEKVDWYQQLQQLSYALGKPDAQAVLKHTPEDFKVVELMPIQACGEGEHYWLDISKVKNNTDQVAKSLARYASVAYRDVGYSGLKDFFADTRQWFSVWMPHDAQFDWQGLSLPGVIIHQVVKHSRKIKRGTHSGNRFKIVMRNVSAQKNDLQLRLDKIISQGVPNYFGPQRFGRNADNMRQAYAVLAVGNHIKNRNLRGLIISSARSWMFNHIVSNRVKAQNWLQLQANEPANLNGSNSVFVTENSPLENQRLNALDIHPTAPLWGEGHQQTMRNSMDLHRWESKQLQDFEPLMQGLESQRVKYQRRALRAVPQELEWQLEEGDLTLEFRLSRGQFATSVLRELVSTE